MNSDNVRRTYTKTCTRCYVNKSLAEFYDHTHELRCKKCMSEIRKESYLKNKDKILARVANYRKKNPEKIRDTKLKQAYGVGLDYFNAKLAEQNGVCAGCGRDFRNKWRGREVNMALDHDHFTNEPRGILCVKCNRALGLLEENIETFDNLIKYLNKYKKIG